MGTSGFCVGESRVPFGNCTRVCWVGFVSFLCFDNKWAKTVEGQRGKEWGGFSVSSTLKKFVKTLRCFSTRRQKVWGFCVGAQRVPPRNCAGCVFLSPLCAMLLWVFRWPILQIVTKKCDRVGKGKGRKTLPVDNGCTKSIKRRLKWWRAVSLNLNSCERGAKKDLCPKIKD